MSGNIDSNFSVADKRYFAREITKYWDTEKFGDMPKALSQASEQVTQSDSSVNISQRAKDLAQNVENFCAEYTSLANSILDNSEHGQLKEDVLACFRQACEEQFGGFDRESSGDRSGISQQSSARLSSGRSQGDSDGSNSSHDYSSYDSSIGSDAWRSRDNSAGHASYSDGSSFNSSYTAPPVAIAA
ncbi:uncharacterized protein I303_105045 [Kwoniella dejecticola CBS 10117]|uniref:Uncharacterized protein n=1 Tax=Kwoniella dejecticola CBS 10117 TaxID=1296121 RepID=A0A1A6A3L9_9TREE|nr:uncharacterized protein I303_05509 [Kwoniella dejecticola CBS 10117]OBR84650.1 hypothetical protein I303_05509 [Kwoniella dejecticola CBS 10117]